MVWVSFVVFLDPWGWAGGLLSHAVGWAGAVLCPWLGANMTFDANGLIQLRWWRHLTLRSCTECLRVWWPGKEAAKEWDNFVTIYLTLVCKWINDILSKKATYVWHLLCMSVIFIAIWHNPNTWSGIFPKCFALAHLFPSLQQMGILLLISVWREFQSGKPSSLLWQLGHGMWGELFCACLGKDVCKDEPSSNSLWVPMASELNLARSTAHSWNHIPRNFGKYDAVETFCHLEIKTEQPKSAPEFSWKWVS